MSSNRLLIIDDEPEVAAVIGRVARSAGYDTIVTTDIDDFLDRVASWDPTVIALDLSMPDLDGLLVLDRLAGFACRAHILIVSGRDAISLAEAVERGRRHDLLMAGILHKPLRLDALRSAFRDIFEAAGMISKADLARALAEGQFMLEYQPKLDLRSMATVGFEALARWHHPTRGVISPTIFVPLLEQSELILDFTRAILDVAVAQARRWHDEGDRYEIAVNISGRCWGAIDVADLVVETCSTHALEPRWLVLELTETAAMVDVARSLEMMRRLASMGVGLSLDDFGAGYSSLFQLHRLPFTEIKIDRSFVADCDTNPDSRIMVQSMTELAHKFGQRVVAEGIETQSVLQALADLGCDMVQGFLFARPLPAALLPGAAGPGVSLAPVAG